MAKKTKKPVKRVAKKASKAKPTKRSKKKSPHVKLSKKIISRLIKKRLIVIPTTENVTWEEKKLVIRLLDITRIIETRERNGLSCSILGSFTS